MSLNRLHRIFRSNSSLSRDDIRAYGSQSDNASRHAIEEKASGSFESDALEGWEQVNYNTSAMSALDKKFAAKSYINYYLFGTIAVAAIVIGSYFALNVGGSDLQPDKETTDQLITGLDEDQQIILDESDVIIPEPIQQMVEAAPIAQVKVEVIKNDFKEKQEQPHNEVKIEIESLPVLEIEIPEPSTPEIVREHFNAKEIYFFDLKLVDYTKYRSNPTVKTKQIILTGTPANKENEESEELDPIWKDVSIPYEEYIKKSMKIFGKGQYKRALTRFETVIATYNDDVNANFYGGLCLYNLKEYEKAISFFNSCIRGPYSNFDEEAQWLIGLSYEVTGDSEKARKIFQSIVDQNGYYKSQAQKKLK